MLSVAIADSVTMRRVSFACRSSFYCACSLAWSCKYSWVRVLRPEVSRFDAGLVAGENMRLYWPELTCVRGYPGVPLSTDGCLVAGSLATLR